jgi:D-glycero-alpha-D-manno-heptose-7-phosphate kinase
VVRIRISRAGDIEVVQEHELFEKLWSIIERHALLVDTRVRRTARKPLRQLQKSFFRRETSPMFHVSHVARMRDRIQQSILGESARALGQAFHDHWMLKRESHAGMTNARLDDAYAAALRAGAFGGKLMGAGAGGCFLFLCPEESLMSVQRRLKHLGMTPIDFQLDPSGLYVDSVAVVA